MSVGIFGINNPSLVQGFDTNNSKVSKLKNLQSHFLSSRSSWQSTKYEVPVDPIIFNMCNDYTYMCSTAKRKLNMGSKFSQINCGVPSVHYEIKKPAVNIIGGYVGAKSQQNRENQNYFEIHEILADLLPDILSENSLRSEDFPEFQPEKTFGNKADCKIKAEVCLQNITFQMEETVNLPIRMESTIYPSNMCPSKGNVREFSQHHAMGEVNANMNSPTYASVASTPAMSSKIDKPSTKDDAGRSTDASTTNKTVKGRKECRGYKNRKYKRKRKTNKANRSDTNELAGNVESSDHTVANSEHFPSLLEETALQEPLMSDIAQDVLATSVDEFTKQCAELKPDYLCSYDEVDSPHSTNYSCSPQENIAHAKGSNFVCQNNSIAFIMNGNDELSDTDSDWSCENKDSFQDEVWDSFREDFECFQNIFVFESFYPNRTNVDGDCELQDEELCVYINQLGNDSELHAAEILAARLKEVNEKWDRVMKDVALDEKRTKVQFAPDNILVDVCCFERCLEELPSESWEHYQLDRCRFRNRVKELETIISPCLESIHRQKVWDRLSCKAKHLEASTQED